MNDNGQRTRRQEWMAILSRASAAELNDIARSVTLPAHVFLKRPEVGSVMVEGRAGGTGARFNLGEATVTRCVIRTHEGVMGHAYALGRDKRKAELAALLDAVLQNQPQDGSVNAAIERLRTKQASQRDTASRKAAATKVEFFTMVRGE